MYFNANFSLISCCTKVQFLYTNASIEKEQVSSCVQGNDHASFILYIVKILKYFSPYNDRQFKTKFSHVTHFISSFIHFAVGNIFMMWQLDDHWKTFHICKTTKYNFLWNDDKMLICLATHNVYDLIWYTHRYDDRSDGEISISSNLIFFYLRFSFHILKYVCFVHQYINK